MAETAAFKYRAFLSYSHRDAAAAKWLHAAVESYRIDKDLAGRDTPAGPVPKTLRPIFRDREDFSAGHSLNDQTLAALEASQFLIVLCSPHAAQSKYVNEETRRFKAMCRADRVIPVIVDGEPGDSDRECFPPALRFKLAPDGTITDEPEEPIAADARPQGDGRQIAALKVVAGLLGLGLDEIIRRAEHARRRRNRLWTAVAAVFLVLALAATGSAVYAWQQLKNNEAFLNATLQRAIEIVNTAVSQAQKYHVPSAATLELLGKAEGLFDDMARLGRPTPELRFRKAQMLLEFAHNYQILGNTDKQKARVTEAHDLVRGLVGEQPDNRRFQWGLSTVLREIGSVLRTRGDLPAALASFRESLMVAERLVKANPNDRASQRNVYLAHERIGGILRSTGDLSSALESFRAMQTVVRRLAEAEPNNLAWQIELAASDMDFGDVALSQRDVPGALASFRDGLAILERLIKLWPENTDWQSRLAQFHEKIGIIQRTQHEFDAALASLRESLVIRERQAKADSTNAPLQSLLAATHRRIGRVLKQQNDLSAALLAFSDSLAISTRLAAADPNNAVWQRNLANSLILVGEVLDAQKQRVSARTYFQQALAIQERMAAANPDNASWLQDVATSNENLGRLARLRGDVPAARAFFHISLDIRAQLAKSAPANLQWKLDLVLSHWYLARLGQEQEYWALTGELLRGLRNDPAFNIERERWLLKMEAEVAERLKTTAEQ